MLARPVPFRLGAFGHPAFAAIWAASTILNIGTAMFDTGSAWRMSEGELMDYTLSNVGMLKAQFRIVVALMLHDIRSRFGGNALGFVGMGICWPLLHMLLALTIFSLTGRTAPYGDSTALWFATGVVPFLGFQYMSRFIVLGLIMNRSLLSFPVVKVSDIVFAGAI